MSIYVGFEVLTAVVMNVALFWDIAPCSPYVNRRFGGIYHIYRVENHPSKEPRCSRWPASSMLVSCSDKFYLEDRGDMFHETSVHVRTTQRYIPDDDIILVSYLGCIMNGGRMIYKR
jgi:hypothetical protein